MRIAVRPRGERVEITFAGKNEMRQTITITKDDALQLRELLGSEEGGFFEND